jgi:predicted dehydrogenase
MVRIAVLGCARIGRMHAANIAAHPRARLAGVYDVDDGRRALLLAETAYKSLAERRFVRVDEIG